MTDVPSLVDHLFRRSAGRMTATLARVLGADHLDLAEDVVQEALATALAQWPYGGVPDDPEAWLFRVARNRAIDVLRRDTKFREKERAVVDAFNARSETTAKFSHELEDDDLQMMLMCCDGRLAAETRLALTLKIVCGFGVDEIARALIVKPEAIAQRIVRAKRFLRDHQIELAPPQQLPTPPVISKFILRATRGRSGEIAHKPPDPASARRIKLRALPSREELPQRLDSLLDVVYLMFNEGYAATAGDDLVRRDLVDEAIRLCEELCSHEATALPKTHALAALMHLQRARLAARVDAAGDLLLLDEQDRSLWDRDAVARGLRHLDQAAAGNELTRFHVEAEIAAEHLFDETDWPHIVELYDDLMSIAPSAVVALNRAIAVAMVDGPDAGLDAAAALEPELRDYVHFHAAIGELSRRAGDREKANEHFRRASELSSTLPLKRWFEKRARLALS
jgi:RNA polymerase sigma-70 factor (ECF subfamily)